MGKKLSVQAKQGSATCTSEMKSECSTTCEANFGLSMASIDDELLCEDDGSLGGVYGGCVSGGVRSHGS